MLDDHALPRADADGILREHVDSDFEASGITQFEEGFPTGKGGAAFAIPAKDNAGDGAPNRKTAIFRNGLTRH